MGRGSTQRALVRRWLNAGGEITPLDALNYFGCFRLGARDYRELVRSGKRMPQSSTLSERFWARVEFGETPSDCWGWFGSQHPAGHGYIAWQGKTYYAHRISWELNGGTIPEGMVVCHRCDNPPCCNPAHLFVGTQADNMRDMWAKGRGVFPVRPRSTEHGTTTQYRNGCRCGTCRVAAVDADRRRTQAKSRQ